MKLTSLLLIAAVFAAFAAAIAVPGHASAASAGVKVTKHATLGDVLTDDAGKTLYLFFRDEREKSNCTGTCATNWPPLISSDPPTAGTGVTAARLGRMARSDGAMQVTYNGYPLYYWNGDAAAGETKGQAVGGNWWVVSPFGGPVQDAATVKITKIDQFGTFLVDTGSRSVYMFTRDTKDTSACTGNCLLTWPPLLTVGAPVAGDGVDATKLSTITHAQGTKLVTYNGLPLYYYSPDVKPGDLKGQNNGRVWYVMAPDGTQIKTIPNGGVTAATGAVTASAGGAATTTDGWAAASVASGAATGDTNIRVTSLTSGQGPASRKAPWAIAPSSRSVNFEVTDAAGKAVSGERTGILSQVCVSYTEADMTASYGGVMSLSLAAYSAANDDWTPLTSSNDLVKRQVCAMTSRHGLFTVMGVPRPQ